MSRTPPYPRGTPFKPPVAAPADLDAIQPPEPAGHRTRTRETRAPEPAAQLQELRDREARLRRWGIWLVSGTAVIVVLTLIVGAVIVNRALDRIDRLAPSQQAPTEPSRKVESAVLPLPPRADPAPVQQPRETPPPLVEKPREPVPAARDRALEVVGGLTAGHLYQSYLNIGMLADAVENEVYTDAEAKRLLGTVTSLMDTVDLQLTRLNEALDDAEDRKRLTQVRQLTGLLRTQAKELRGYWDVPAKDMELRKQHELKFHKARDEAWTGIKELLGIKEE
jgi:hypothetical protein